MTTNDQDWLRQACANAVHSVWHRLAVPGNGAIHIWFKRGSIVAAEEQPEGYELAFNERLPGNKEKDQLQRWVWDRMQRVPCLPPEPVVPSAIDFEKATIYHGNSFGPRKVEVKAGKARLVQHAQYASAVQVSFIEPRKRQWKGFTEDSPRSLLILKGWGHPDPASPFGPETRSESGLLCSSSRYSCFDPRWGQEFDAMIDVYLAKLPASTVIADYRKHSAHAPLVPAVIEAEAETGDDDGGGEWSFGGGLGDFA